VRVFKFKWFHRFTGKEGITDSELKEIVKQFIKTLLLSTKNK